MKKIALVTTIFIAILFSQKCFSSAKVVKVFDTTFTEQDLILSTDELNQFAQAYPELTKNERNQKLRKNKISQLVWKLIIDDFSKQHNVQPSKEQVFDMMETSGLFDLPTNNMSEEEIEQGKMMLYDLAENYVKTFNLSKALYEKYGGTVIFQQGNPHEPVDAYLSLLEELTQQGKLAFFNKNDEAAFFSYYRRNHPMVIPPEKVDFSKPWWE